LRDARAAAATLRWRDRLRLGRGIPALLTALLVIPCTAFASIGVNKTFSPTNVSAGQSSTLTVILINNNAVAATGAAFTDTLPGTVVVANPANASTTCAGGTVTATPGAGSFSLAGGTIPAASANPPTPGQCTAQVDVVSPTSGVFINTIPVGGVTSSQGSNPQAAQATLTVAALTNVTGTKTFAPGNVHGNGNPSTVTITLTNPNGVTLTNAAFTDTLPNPIAIAPTPNASTTCAGGTVSTGVGSASLAGATIPANASCIVRFDIVAANPNSVTNANATNTIAAGALTTAQGVTNSAISGAIRVQKGVQVTKAFAPSTIASGATSTLTVTINDFNASTIGPIAFTDNLPGTMRIAATPNATTTCAGATITAVAAAATFSVSGGSLAGVAANAGISNTSCTVSVNVTATNATANPVTLTNQMPNGNFGGATYEGPSAPLIVQGSSTVTGTKTFAPATVLQGGTTTATITLTNSAAVAATITAFTDNLNTMGTGFTNAGGATTTCGGAITATAGTTLITLGAGNTIPASGSCTITAPVQVAANAQTGNRTNTIAVGALQTDQGNNQLAITRILSVSAVLSVTKAFAPTTVAAGTDSRLTITLTRAANATSLSGITFTDTLPAGHVVSSNPNIVSTCGGVITTGANTISLAGGGLAGGVSATSCTIAVNITTPSSAGAATNAIAAGSVTTTEGFVNAAAAQATLTRAITNVTLNKSFSPATVAIGGTSQLTINVLNNNANAIALTSGALTDTLPAGMVVATPPAATNTCGGAFSAVAGASSVSLTNASIAANATCRVQVNVVANLSGNLINTLAAGAFTSAQHVTNPLPASATLTATGSADLSITKTDGTTTATPGGTTTYTIVARNNGPNGVAGASVIDTPPAGMTFTGWTCSASAGSSCTASGSGAINDLVTLLNGGTATYTVTAQIAAGASGSITNTASVAAPASVVDSNPANDSASDTDTLAPVVALAVAKTDGSPTYTPGTNATYTVTVTNAGPSDASNVTVADSMPAGVTLSGTVTCVASAGSSCGTVTGTAGQTSFGSTGAYITAGGGSSLVFTVPVSFAPALATNPLVNTVSATDLASGNSANGSDSDTRTAVANVALVKSGPATINAGATITYTLTISNAGPSAANGATFSDNVPAGITGITASCGSASGGAVCPASVGVAGNAVSGSVPVLPPGGSVVITISGTAPASGPLSNTGSVSPPAGTSDPNLADNSSTVNTAITPVADVSLVKAGPANIDAGSTITYTLTIANAGPSAANGATFSDNVPAAITGVGASCGGASGGAACPGSISVAGNSVSGAIPTLPAGGSVVITITGTAPASGVLSNTGTVSAPTGVLDPNAGNNSSTVSANVTLVSDLAITKHDGSATYTPGGTATYTIVVTNAGPSDALNVTVSDPLPAGVTLSADVACVASGSASCGTVTGTSGQSAFATTGATIAAGAGNNLTFTVPVAFTSAMITDPLVNTATASDPASPTRTASDSDTRLVQVALTVAKTDGSATYTPGGIATYTVTVTNAGPSDVADVTVTDTLPPGVTLTAPVGCAAIGAANCGSVTGASGHTSFSAAGASIAAGAAHSLVFTAPVAYASNLTTDPLVNTATATDVATGASASGSDSDLRLLNVSLAVVKTDGSTSYTPGGSATYTVTVANGGTSDALDVSVTDALPAGVTLSANATCTPSGNANCGAVVGTAGQSAFGATAVFIGAGSGNSITLVAPVVFGASLTTDPLVNTASAVDAASGASGSGTDSDIRAPNVTLALTKNDGSATYTPGGVATYTITIANTGASDALNVTLADPLPAGVTLNANAMCVATGSASCGTVVGSAGQTSFGTTGATIAHGAGNVLAFTAPVAFAANLTTDPLINTVTVNDVASGVTAAASDSDARAASADLSIYKSGPPTAIAGVDMTYTLTIANAGPSAADGATYSDTLPAVISSISASCGSAAGGAICGAVTVTGNEVSGVVAVLPFGGSVVVTITGKPTAAGIMTNSARVIAPPGVGDPNPANDTSTATTAVSAQLPIASVPIPVSSRPMLALLALLLLGLAAAQLRARR